MKKFKIFVCLFILFIISIFLYSRHIEPHNINVVAYYLSNKVSDSYKNLKIVHFSDVLLSPEYTINDLENAVVEINSLNPDIVLFTGDLYDTLFDLDDETTELLIKTLSKIESSLYKFAIFGDHDVKNKFDYTYIMDSSSFIVLDDETFLLYYKDAIPITITGITDINNIDDAYSDVDAYMNITLIHKPDYFDILNKADIVLSGHSLGGYINIPYTDYTINRTGAKNYISGNYKLDNRNLYVSNGLGLEKYYFRFNNTPSINVFFFE